MDDPVGAAQTSYESRTEWLLPILLLLAAPTVILQTLACLVGILFWPMMMQSVGGIVGLFLLMSALSHRLMHGIPGLLRKRRTLVLALAVGTIPLMIAASATTSSLLDGGAGSPSTKAALFYVVVGGWPLVPLIIVLSGEALVFSLAVDERQAPETSVD